MKVLIANPPWDPGSCRAGSRWAHGAEEARKKKTFLDNLIARLSRWEAQKYSDTYHNFPYFMAYSAAVLEGEGFEVSVIDSLALEQTVEDFLKDVKNFGPSVVVFETSTPSFNNDIEIIKLVKDSHRCRVVLCGTHPTSLPKECLKLDEVDFVVMGEYEMTLRNLMKAIDDGSNLSEVRGIAFKQDGEIKINESAGLVDLDKLPLPAYHLMPLDKYFTPVPGANSAIEVLSSRGCPFSCTYCIFPQLLYRSKKIRFRDPKEVLGEIQILKEKYALDGVFFDDDTFTANKDHVLAICTEIKKRGIKFKWSCFGRVDTVDEEMLKAMKEAGCVQVRYGVESGSQKVLDNVKKGFTVEQIRTAFKLTKRVGLGTHATVMVGLPGETRETIEQTLELAKEIDADSSVWALLTPFPGTEIYKEASAKGQIVVKDWGKYDGYNYAIMRTDEMSIEEMEKAYADVQRRWRLHIRAKPKTLIHFIRTAYRNGGIPNLIRAGLIKTLQVYQDIINSL